MSGRKCVVLLLCVIGVSSLSCGGAGEGRVITVRPTKSRKLSAAESNSYFGLARDQTAHRRAWANSTSIQRERFLIKDDDNSLNYYADFDGIYGAKYGPAGEFFNPIARFEDDFEVMSLDPPILLSDSTFPMFFEVRNIRFEHVRVGDRVRLEGIFDCVERGTVRGWNAFIIEPVEVAE